MNANINDIKCDICGKTFSRKSSLKYHMDKRVCGVDLLEINNDNDIKCHKCEYCNKGFTTKTSMYRHKVHTCKIKRKEDNENDEKEHILEKLILDQIDEHKEELKEELKEEFKKELKKELNNQEKKYQKQINEQQKEINNLKKKLNKNQFDKNQLNKNQQVSNKTINKQQAENINNGTVNNNTTNNNIILVGYGKEELSRLDEDEMLYVLQNGFTSTVKLTELVHFNPKYPEYHNIYISNIKDNYAMVYDGEKWELTLRDDLIETIYDDKKTHIEDSIDTFINSLSRSRINALRRWLDIDDETADEKQKQKIKKIKRQIKLVLYNKRGMGIASKKAYDIQTKTIKGRSSNVETMEESSDVESTESESNHKFIVEKKIPISKSTKRLTNKRSDNTKEKSMKVVKTINKTAESIKSN